MSDQVEVVKGLKKQEHRFYLNVAVTVILFIAGFLLWRHYTLHGILESIVPAAMIAGFYWGCLLLFPMSWGRPSTKTRPKWLTITLWALYYIVKVVLAFFIGVFVGMYEIGRGVQRLRDTREIEKE